MAKKEIKIEPETIMGTPKPKPESVEAKSSENVSSDTVTMQKSDLTALFDRLDKQAKDIEMLYQASDKSRLAKAQSNGGQDVLIHTAKISRWDGGDKYVIGWKLTNNRSEIINGRWVEEQLCNVILDEGEPLVGIPLLEFYRKTIQKDSGEIIGRDRKFDKQSNQEIEILHLELSNGRKIDIMSNFVN